MGEAAALRSVAARALHHRPALRSPAGVAPQRHCRTGGRVRRDAGPLPDACGCAGSPGVCASGPASGQVVVLVAAHRCLTSPFVPFLAVLSLTAPFLSCVAGGSSLPGQSNAPNFTAAYSQIVRGDRACTPPSASLTPTAAPGDSDPPQPVPLSLGVEGGQEDASPPPCAMGLSVRVPGWRYTAWLGFAYGVDPSVPGNSTVGPDWDDVRGEELYDHRADDSAALTGDPGNDFDLSELVNVAGQPQFEAQQAALRALLVENFPVRP